jgi:predicted O-linked N-acetylglucosamine transferase (SPINDLY family)
MSDAPSRLQALRSAATERYRRGEFEAAERLIAEALQLDPQSPELWSNRGTAQAACKKREAALTSFTRAIQLKPDFLGAIANRAHILFELRRYTAAIPDYQRLVQADPDHPYAIGNLMFCKLQCCDWSDFENDSAQIIAALHGGKRALPPVLSAALLSSAADQLRAAQIVVRDKIPPAPPLWRGETYRHQRIRVAYVSADFHAHATAVLTAGLFEHHDRTRFETVAVSFGPEDNSALRARLKGSFERFIEMRTRSDAEIARHLRELEIDIAVDLKGFTSDARPAIFAARPAPLQINYLGFPGTMGANFMDYILADRFVVPESEQAFYSEKIAWLPDCYQPNDKSREIANPELSRAAAGLQETGLVFCCFNNSYKIQPRPFEIWMRLLSAVEGSVLWLLADNPTAVSNLKREAAARGVDADRLVFAPRQDPPQHLARHRLADLFLDTLPYNAHTTASDALWAGLPVLTCTGTTFAGGVAASVLNAAGLPELVTNSLSEYETLALKLARDPAGLAALKAKLAASRETSALFDAARFTRDLEAAYSAMHERHQRGLPPASFAVERTA